MRTKIALVCALALAMGLMAGTALARSSGDKSTGGVSWERGIGGIADASFNAHETPTGAKGQVNVTGIGGAAGDIWYKGTVDCYWRIDDDSARFSGTVDDSNDPAARGFFVIAVEDNGSPGWRDPADQIIQNLRATPVNCETDTLTPGNDVIRGNLVVHHR
jgi:hypothetical protein